MGICFQEFMLKCEDELGIINVVMTVVEKLTRV